jgi:paraquat-inducible protein B
MKTDRQTTVGLFVIGGVVLAVGAILLFGKFHIGSTSRRYAVVFQDSISGLAVGAPVNFRGVRVGSVLSIALEFDPKTHVAYIPVIVRMFRDNIHVSKHDPDDPVMSNLVKRGLRAEINQISFVTGQSEIDLDFDPSSPAIFHPDITGLTEIPAKVSDLERVKQQITQLPLRELADNANATLQTVHKLAENLVDDLPGLIASLKATSDHSQVAVDEAARSIAELRARLDTTLDSISRLASSSDKQVTLRGADLHNVLAQASLTVTKARAVLDNMQGLTSQHAGARIDIEASLRDLAAAAAALRGFASDVERNPQLLLTGRRP